MSENEIVTADNSTPVPTDFWDELHPRSVVNMVAPNVREAFKLARAQHPDLFDMDEKDLFKHLQRNNMTPSQTDNKLRMKFWSAIDHAYAEHKQSISVPQIVAGVCSAHYFWSKYLKSASRVAWLLCRPLSFESALEETLNFSTMRMRQILDLNPVDPVTGKIDTKLASLQMKIHVLTETRLHGTAVQRSEQKSVSVNVTSTDKQIAQVAIQSTQSELDRRIAELRRREKVALNLPVLDQHDKKSGDDIKSVEPDEIV